MTDRSLEQLTLRLILTAWRDATVAQSIEQRLP
jgi:hypothetical protein